MTFKVMRQRCDQCLYGPDKIVSNRRRAEILRGLKQTGKHFICHKATIAGKKVACHGDWEKRGCGQMGRIAQRLRMVTFVSEESLESPA